MRGTLMKTLDNFEEHLLSELETVRETEDELARELRDLQEETDEESAGAGRRLERLREDLIPHTRELRLELEARIARLKAQDLEGKTTPLKERYELARISLETAQRDYEEARRGWTRHKRSVESANWQADRMEKLLGSLRDHKRETSAS
jgi:molybdopterin converting factor small subunit